MYRKLKFWFYYESIGGLFAASRRRNESLWVDLGGSGGLARQARIKMLIEIPGLMACLYVTIFMPISRAEYDMRHYARHSRQHFDIKPFL